MGDAVRIEARHPLRAGGAERLPLGDHRLPAIARQARERSGLDPADLAASSCTRRTCASSNPLPRRSAPSTPSSPVMSSSPATPSAASIPLAFSKLVERGEITTGDPVLLFGFGGNLSYAGQVVRCP